VIQTVLIRRVVDEYKVTHPYTSQRHGRRQAFPKHRSFGSHNGNHTPMAKLPLSPRTKLPVNLLYITPMNTAYYI